MSPKYFKANPPAFTAFARKYTICGRYYENDNGNRAAINLAIRDDADPERRMAVCQLYYGTRYIPEGSWPEVRTPDTPRLVHVVNFIISAEHLQQLAAQ